MIPHHATDDHIYTLTFPHPRRKKNNTKRPPTSQTIPLGNMSLPHTLPALTTREAITDAVIRAHIGLDRHDPEMYTSAWAGEDVVFEIFGRTVHGLSNLRTQNLAHIGPMDTTHMLNSVRVDVEDGADTARLTAYATGQHAPPGRGKEPDGPKFLIAGEYTADVVRDPSDGLWKMRKWVIDVIWQQGDPSVVKRPE